MVVFGLSSTQKVVLLGKIQKNPFRMVWTILRKLLDSFMIFWLILFHIYKENVLLLVFQPQVDFPFAL